MAHDRNGDRVIARGEAHLFAVQRLDAGAPAIGPEHDCAVGLNH
jgi:hypothetical protein